MPTEELYGAYNFLLEGDSAAAKDSFDFTAKGGVQQIALLLPAVQAAREAASATDDGSFTTKDDGGTAYEYKLDGVMISSYDVGGSSDSGHDKWIDVLSTDWGMDRPGGSAVKEAGLRSDGELVQAVSEADMSGDFIF